MRINAVILPATAVAVLVIGFTSLGNQDYESPTPLAWLCLAYSALGTLVITNLLWFRVVGKVGAAKSSYFLNIQPFGAALLAWLLLGETITVVQILGRHRDRRGDRHLAGPGSRPDAARVRGRWVGCAA